MTPIKGIPADWEYTNGKKQQALLAEYQLELPTVNPRYRIDVAALRTQY
ncbi:hypothetical protein [Pectobacterium odoriferum]|nr:hypothetical protein [Pectobacterium odoriferum]